MMIKTLVTHPGLQHSHQMAQALYEQDLLGQYWSGVPVSGPGEAPPWWLPAKHRAKLREVAIPRALRRHPVFFPAMLKLGLYRCVGGSPSAYAHRIFHLFDQWVAGQVEAIRPEIVVAYENSALKTFQAARRIGAKCVLEAPAVHHRTAREMLPAQDNRYLAAINAQKDGEVALADLIITCSAFAAQSYEEAGVPANKLKPLLLGASLPDGLARRRTDGNTRFLFAGRVSYLKGSDLLLQAFAKLRSSMPEVELVIAGTIEEPALAAQIAATPGVIHLGALPQRELFQVFADADCFVLPSRFDSFGMVVAEALACGVPVVLSDRVGAKEILNEFPAAGWIIPLSAQALYERMRELSLDRIKLEEARAHACLAGARYSWARYRQEAAKTIAALC